MMLKDLGQTKKKNKKTTVSSLKLRSEFRPWANFANSHYVQNDQVLGLILWPCKLIVGEKLEGHLLE
jgi:hypothetical protein